MLLAPIDRYPRGPPGGEEQKHGIRWFTLRLAVAESRGPITRRARWRTGRRIVTGIVRVGDAVERRVPGAEREPVAFVRRERALRPNDARRDDEHEDETKCAHGNMISHGRAACIARELLTAACHATRSARPRNRSRARSRPPRSRRMAPRRSPGRSRFASAGMEASSPRVSRSTRCR